MSNREQLFENYEDALFALLMDDLAEVEGERLLELNEELKKDPDAAVPADVQQRCIDVINREFAKKKRTASRQRAKKVLKILPWAVVIAMALMAVAMAAFPSFRAGIFNIIQSNTPNHDTWSFSEEGSVGSTDIISSLSFSVFVPENYTIEDISIGEINEYVLYRDSEDPNIFFSILVIRSDGTAISFDNEDIDAENEFDFQKHTAKVFSKGSSVRLIWVNPDIPCSVIFESENVSMEEIESIFCSIKV